MKLPLINFVNKTHFIDQLFTIYKFEGEINLLCRITATNIFGGFLGTGGAY